MPAVFHGSEEEQVLRDVSGVRPCRTEQIEDRDTRKYFGSFTRIGSLIRRTDMVGPQLSRVYIQIVDQ